MPGAINLKFYPTGNCLVVRNALSEVLILSLAKDEVARPRNLMVRQAHHEASFTSQDPQLTISTLPLPRS